MCLSSGITKLLREARQGRHEAADELMPMVYDQLRRLAETYLRNDRPGHTLVATALGEDYPWLCK